MQSVIKEHVAFWFILSLSTDSGLYFSLFTLLVLRRLCHHPSFRDEGLRLRRVSSTVLYCCGPNTSELVQNRNARTNSGAHSTSVFLFSDGFSRDLAL